MVKKLIFLFTTFFIFGISQSSAFDVVSSPTSYQNGFSINSNSGLITLGGYNGYIDGKYFFNDQSYGYRNCYYKTHFNNNIHFIECDYQYSNVSGTVYFLYNLILDKFIGIYDTGFLTYYGDTPSSAWNYMIKNNGPYYMNYPVDNGNFFYKDGLVITTDGSNLRYYQINNEFTDLGEYINGVWQSKQPLQTLPVLPGFVAPDNSKGIPVYITGIGSGNRNGWYYIGTDNKGHFLEENNAFIDNTILDGQELLPLQMPVNSLSDKSIFWSNRNSLYPSILSYLDNNKNWQTINNYNTGSVINQFTYYDNPNLYLKLSDNSIKKWNLNCLTPGYTSTKLDTNDNKYYCASDDGSTFQDPKKYAGEQVNFITASCTDGIKNQDETGVDVGGICDTQVQHCYTGTIAGTEQTIYNKEIFETRHPIDLNGNEILGFKLGIIDSTFWDNNSKFLAGFGASTETITGSNLWDTWKGQGTTYFTSISSYFYDTELKISLLSPTVTSSGKVNNTGFNYIRIDGFSSSTFKIKGKSRPTDFESSKSFEMSGNYKFNEYIKLDFYSDDLTLIFEDGKDYKITNIDIGTYTYSSGTPTRVCETLDMSPEEYNKIINSTGANIGTEALKISNDINEITKSELNSIENQFKTDNPFLKKLFDYIKNIIDSLGLKPFFDFLNLFVPDTPSLGFNLPVPTLSNKAELGIQLFPTELVPISDPYNKVKIAPSVYGPFFISFFSSILYLVFYSATIYFLFVFNVKMLFYIDVIAVNLLGRSTISNNNTGNIWTFVFSFSFWAFIIKQFLVFLGFMLIIMPLVTLIRDFILVIISWISVSFGGYANFVLITNTLIKGILIGVVLYILMHLSNRFGKLN